ncbi:kallikrein 1-related peptidase b5-like [Drosophila rhopaloa]|uniref:Kallikrein 1-related peptidase b5-like n=1 Tax=Drosophila rhopaloa TaxID=1041015 RepID=A0A6P4F206_DRORH|nr:kallikrein 1-related peptidase b5-like [Drosophila rhopaloa]
MIAAEWFFILALLIRYVSSQLLDPQCSHYSPNENQDAPWIAQIISTTKNCTGVLINKHFVLTAASCVAEGKSSFFCLSSDCPNWIPVKTVHIPKPYNANGKDIALLELKTPVDYKRIRPICILLTEFNLEDGMILKGWTGRSRTTKITKLNNIDCRNSFGNFPNSLQICAGSKTNKVCEEYGSPLGIDAFSSSLAGYVLIGIQMYGASGICVYSDISAYIDWIVSVVLKVEILINVLSYT